MNKWIFIFFSLLLLHCSTRPPVSRIAPNSTLDLSGNWNDVDSRIVSKDMVKSVLSSGWVNKYDYKSEGPTVIVGNIKNKSGEVINTETFVKDIERNLLNSGKVALVASKKQRRELREEVEDQNINSSIETRKAIGEEYGADVMLVGTINTIFDESSKNTVKFYQVDLELIELSTNRKRWIGNKKIKKFMKSKNIEKQGSYNHKKFYLAFGLLNSNYKDKFLFNTEDKTISSINNINLEVGFYVNEYFTLGAYWIHGSSSKEFESSTSIFDTTFDFSSTHLGIKAKYYLSKGSIQPYGLAHLDLLKGSITLDQFFPVVNRQVEYSGLSAGFGIGITAYFTKSIGLDLHCTGVWGKAEWDKKPFENSTSTQFNPSFLGLSANVVYAL